ncbi:MAG: hypothetical protein U9Q58_03750 [Pseudomonadota bacterium]|nr:hypothetical protein [Pseudomonadota bacterium]
MKNTLRIVTLVAILQANSAFAASAVAGGGGIGLAGWIFIGFMALIVVCQFVPVVFMLGSMLVGVFGKAMENDKVLDNQ